MTITERIPVFIAVGIAMTFTTVFMLIDCVSCVLMASGLGKRPLVENSTQVYLLLVAVTAMGFVSGFLFGYFDLEDELNAVWREQHYAIPASAVFGAIGGCINEVIRQKVHTLDFISTETQ